MEYYDPDEVVPRNSPMLVPQKMRLETPEPLEPWCYDLYEPGDGENFMENDFWTLARAVRRKTRLIVYDDAAWY